MEGKKLKPAKQALADAIHQNGGWEDYHLKFATSNSDNVISMWKSKPCRDDGFWRHHGNFADGARRVRLCRLNARLQNWHQIILSRDEYFTAYPEQVKVDVNNETEHKVEVEMKYESEITIKVSEWHKNGELPPVGEACEVLGTCDGKPAWGVGVIVAHTSFTDKTEIAIARHDDIFDFGWGGPEVFRPLRTEREKEIDEMLKDSGALRCETVESIIENLLDAGWKKGDK